MRMEVLHCKTVSGVLKELTVFAIVYNLVRMVMWHSAGLQHVGVERIGVSANRRHGFGRVILQNLEKETSS
jgi:hypothetical protein